MIAPRYHDLSALIESRIRSGEWQDRLPGTAVLGQLLGANPRTISRAIRELEEKGLVTTNGTKGTFIRDLHPARPRYGTIGIVGPLFSAADDTPEGHLVEAPSFSPAHAYDERILHLDELLADRGLSAMELRVRPQSCQQQTRLLTQLPVDGLILLAGNLLTAEVVAALRQGGLPFVSLTAVFQQPGIPYVDYNHAQGFREVCEGLRSRGHQRVGYLGLRYVTAEVNDQLEAVYRDVFPAADANLWFAPHTLSDAVPKFETPLHVSFARAGICRLMAQDPPPTAIYVAHWRMAKPAFEALRRLGRVVPRDLALVAGLDVERETVSPGDFFSYLDLPVRQRTETALDELLRAVDRPDRKPFQHLLPRHPVWQASTGPLPKG